MACYSQQEINELVAFADISENSHMPHEREVLFDLGATFEIEDIKQRSKKKDYITIRLTPYAKELTFYTSFGKSVGMKSKIQVQR